MTEENFERAKVLKQQIDFMQEREKELQKIYALICRNDIAKIDHNELTKCLQYYSDLIRYYVDAKNKEFEQL